MEYSLKRLTPEHVMLPFDCGDDDLMAPTPCFLICLS